MPHARIQTLLSEGSNFELLFFSFDERKDPNTNINGPSSARQRYAILMGFHWRAYYDTNLNTGLLALFFRGSEPVLIRNHILL